MTDLERERREAIAALRQQRDAAEKATLGLGERIIRLEDRIKALRAAIDYVLMPSRSTNADGRAYENLATALRADDEAAQRQAAAFGRARPPDSQAPATDACPNCECATAQYVCRAHGSSGVIDHLRKRLVWEQGSVSNLKTEFEFKLKNYDETLGDFERCEEALQGAGYRRAGPRATLANTLVPALRDLERLRKDNDGLRAQLRGAERELGRGGQADRTAELRDAVEAIREAEVAMASVYQIAFFKPWAGDKVAALIRAAMDRCQELEHKYAIEFPIPSCDDCGSVFGPFIDKGDHHGGTKHVCQDRDACHEREALKILIEDRSEELRQAKEAAGELSPPKPWYFTHREKP